MDLIEEFLRNLGFWCNLPFNYINFDYHTNTSEMVNVDGEEGDYGIVKYYSENGALLATKHIHGGDDEDIEFTEYGKKIMKEKVLEILDKRISEN